MVSAIVFHRSSERPDLHSVLRTDHALHPPRRPPPPGRRPAAIARNHHPAHPLVRHFRDLAAANGGIQRSRHGRPSGHFLLRPRCVDCGRLVAGLLWNGYGLYNGRCCQSLTERRTQGLTCLWIPSRRVNSTANTQAASSTLQPSHYLLPTNFPTPYFSSATIRVNLYLPG